MDICFFKKCYKVIPALTGNIFDNDGMPDIYWRAYEQGMVRIK